MNRDAHYTAILLEDLRDQYKLLFEMLSSMNDYMKTLATKKSVDDLTVRADVLASALTATNKDLAKNTEDLEKVTRDLAKNTRDLQKNNHNLEKNNRALEKTNKQLNRHEIRLTNLEVAAFRPLTG